MVFNYMLFFIYLTYFWSSPAGNRNWRNTSSLVYLGEILRFSLVCWSGLGLKVWVRHRRFSDFKLSLGMSGVWSTGANTSNTTLVSISRTRHEHEVTYKFGVCVSLHHYMLVKCINTDYSSQQIFDPFFTSEMCSVLACHMKDIKFSYKLRRNVLFIVC